jgi:4-azaleucine resistance transporter AzlC
MSELDPPALDVSDGETVSFTWAGLWAGARRVLPIVGGGWPFGLVLGILARQSHLSPLEVLLMSSTVYAGSAQLIVLNLWNTPFAFGAIILTTLLVNLRNLLLGITVSRWFLQLPRLKAYGTLFFLADENWALMMNEFAQGRRDAAFLLGSGLVMFVEWVSSTVLGSFLGEGIPNPASWGLDFVFVAVFLALLANLWKGKGDILPWIVAAVVAVASARLLPGAWYILLGALAGSLVGAVRHAD